MLRRLSLLGAVVAVVAGTFIGAGVSYAGTSSSALIYQHVINRNSGKCMQATFLAVINQTTCNTNANQLWHLEPTDSGYYKFVSGANSQCLDITDASQSDGKNAQLYSCHGNYNQQFKLVHVGNGWRQIIARHSGKCLEVDNRGLANGVVIQQFACNGDASRQWELPEV
jgi:hypothetical protein